MSAQKTFIFGLNRRLENGAFLDTKALYNGVGHNTGNVAFAEAIFQHLGAKSDVIGWHAPSDKIDAMGDIAVIPAANQFGAHANFGGLAKKFSELKSKIVMIGLGAQTDLNGSVPDVPQGTVDWIKAIAAHGKEGVPNIAVRGPVTKSILDHYGVGDCALVTGCPSLFMNPDPNLGQTIAKSIRPFNRIAVPSGHQRWKHLGKIEASLARMVTVTNGSYIGQSPEAMVRLCRGEAHLLSEGDLRDCRDYAAPEMTIDEFVRWSKVHGAIFFDVQSWMEHYRRYDFVVGARIHGVMLALQAGVPGLCIAHDSRTLELCQTMMVPYVSAREVSGGISRDQLSKLFRFDPVKFDENRNMLARRYVDFLVSNDLSPAAWLLHLGKNQVIDNSIAN